MLPVLRQALRALGRSPGFTLAAVATFAIGIGAVASWIPARRAVRVSPMQVLRTE